jgi:arginase
LLEGGAPERLAHFTSVSSIAIETSASFVTEIGTAFELHRALSAAVSEALRHGELPLVLSGNCNASLGTVAGIQNMQSTGRLGVIWFDGHGDSNTPQTFKGTFLDAMGLSTLTGRSWQALASTVPGFDPLSDSDVVLVGAHGADSGSREVLAASGIAWVSTDDVHASGPVLALTPALDGLVKQGVTRVYIHLDLDVLDARYAAANEFAPEGGLLPNQLAECVSEVLARFEIAAAGIASYDPAFDNQGRVFDTAMRFLEAVAYQRFGEGSDR